MTDHAREARRPATGSPGKALVWGAALAAGIAVLAVVLLLTREQPRPARDVTPPRASADRSDGVVGLPLPGGRPSPSAAAQALALPRSAVAPAPPLPSVDFFSGDAPELLRKSHDVTGGGGVLNVERMKELYQLGKQPGDARPHLVLAEDAVNRGWEEFAVDHYLRAQKEDLRARQDPRMLKDLVAIAAGKRNGPKAEAALASIYGRAAIPAVEDALAAAGEAGDSATLERLAALSRMLAAAKGD